MFALSFTDKIVNQYAYTDTTINRNTIIQAHIKLYHGIT